MWWYALISRWYTDVHELNVSYHTDNDFLVPLSVLVYIPSAYEAIIEVLLAGICSWKDEVYSIQSTFACKPCSLSSTEIEI